MSDQNNGKRIARWMVMLGTVPAVGCVGTIMGAIWTHGELARRLAETATALGFIAAILIVFGGLASVEL